MAKIADVQEVSLSLLRPYSQNAKIHGEHQLEKLVDSIREFGFLTPCLIDRDYNLIAGHGRVMAAQRLGMTSVPCVFIDGLTEEQRRAYILADNRLGDLGEWDMEIVTDELTALADEDFDISLTGFEMPENWFENRKRWDDSREEGNKEYNEFLDKFEQAKTTDDCYTPDNIYDCVAEYVIDRYGARRENFVRPFYPGGDYERYAYKKTDIVVDNPPFSILSQIVSFYVENGIPFFLFASGLSVMGYSQREGVTAICSYADITYENGANVVTSFVTNMESVDVVALADPKLYAAIKAANDKNEKEMHREFSRYEYPAEVVTSAKLGYLAKYGQSLTIKRKDAQFIRNLDAMKESGKGIFGAGLLLSEKAAAEKAAAEKAAAEKAAAIVWPLSEREIEIVKKLGEGDECG